MLKQTDSDHLSVFQTAAQSIKWWLIQRCLYDKQIGYLNSGASSLLLLKTYMCERGENNSIDVYNLVFAFFKQWSTWPWPAPVMVMDYIPGYDGSRIDYQSLVSISIQ